MKNTKRYSFTLWVHSYDCDGRKVPVCEFSQEASFESISHAMLVLDELGIECSLTCDFWFVYNKSESEDETV